jgi:hypothetical protein
MKAHESNEQSHEGDPLRGETFCFAFRTWHREGEKPDGSFTGKQKMLINVDTFLIHQKRMSVQ